MGTLPLVAVTAVAVWLALLSFALILVVRHVGLLTLHVQAGHVAEGDGLLIGERVPSEAISVADELDSNLRYVVFLSTNCGSCSELAPQLTDVSNPEAVLACVIGDEGRRLVELLDRLPAEIPSISGPFGRRVADAFRIHQTPQALQVENGIVTGRATLRGVDDLRRLMDSHDSSDAEEISITMRKVFDHAV